MNRIIIIGNLGSDPEATYTPSGQMITSFSIASNRRYKTASGEQREETEWFTCQAFGELAELCNGYLAKGQRVYIEGRLKSRTYQTRDGSPVSVMTSRSQMFTSYRRARARILQYPR
jgi:single-strand DNA-binding protein